MASKLSRKLQLGLGIVCLVCSFGQGAIAKTPETVQGEKVRSPLISQLQSATDTLKIDLADLMKPEFPDLSSDLLLQELNDNRATHLVLSISERQVYAYQDDRILKKFPVAVGKGGWETPTGEFKILRMIRNPAWQSPWTGDVIPPAEDNPLGLRWIGFWTDGKDTIGFHGTPNESLIGQAVSHGCVRMKNRDIVALFELVEIGMTVKVIP
ncbi:L,D-transpeptidase [Tumidithrix helvetica PCC 7403]|uniref:L,D-transpeptidase n=1 Tax=Tumidithrix helvetica TaxID=3457545 RepID=UPI003C81880D